MESPLPGDAVESKPMRPNPQRQGAPLSVISQLLAQSLGLVLRVAAVFFILGGVAFGTLAADRVFLPYNEEGRYVDAEASLVYHQQAVAVYGLVAVAGLGGGGVLWILGGRPDSSWGRSLGVRRRDREPE